MANLLVDAGPRLSAGVGLVKEERRWLQGENRPQRGPARKTASLEAPGATNEAREVSQVGGNRGVIDCEHGWKTGEGRRVSPADLPRVPRRGPQNR